MPAGTIALTNNSTTVTGTGTNFTSELKANDFLVAIVGGVTYTLGVQSVNSATGLTLITAYNGPTATGVAWTAVPNAALVGITAQVAADVAKAIRGLNLDKANWQQVYSASGNITVNLPDGSQFSGPSWNAVASSVTGKMDKAKNLEDLADKTAARTNLGFVDGALPVSLGGTSAKTAGDARKNLGIGPTDALFLAALELSGATPYIDFHFANSISDYTCRLINYSSGGLEVLAPTDGNARMRVAGGYQCRGGLTGGYNINSFNFYWNTQNQLEAWVDNVKIGNVSVSSTSDKGLKKDIKYRDDASKALDEVLQWRPADFKMKARGIIPETDDMLGFIANDLVKVSPECVSGKGLPDDYDIEADPNNGDAYNLNQVPMIVKLAQSIQAQQQLINQQYAVIAELQERMKAIDGLGA